jgi:hypothetical protein
MRHAALGPVVSVIRSALTNYCVTLDGYTSQMDWERYKWAATLPIDYGARVDTYRAWALLGYALC